MNNLRRIYADLREVKNAANPMYTALPLEEDMRQWFFTIRGPPDSDFEGGIYHGRIILPSEYPFKPPNIMLLTPSGRFEVKQKICLSLSAHHPESWQPAWGIRTILEAIISFMPSPGEGAVGALDWPPEQRRRAARISRKSPSKATCLPGWYKSHVEEWLEEHPEPKKEDARKAQKKFLPSVKNLHFHGVNDATRVNDDKAGRSASSSLSSPPCEGVTNEGVDESNLRSNSADVIVGVSPGLRQRRRRDNEVKTESELSPFQLYREKMRQRYVKGREVDLETKTTERKDSESKQHLRTSAASTSAKENRNISRVAEKDNQLLLEKDSDRSTFNESRKNVSQSPSVMDEDTSLNLNELVDDEEENVDGENNMDMTDPIGDALLFMAFVLFLFIIFLLGRKSVNAF
eukprot:g1265.t1